MTKEDLLNYLNDRKQQCRLEIMDVATKERKVLKTFDTVIEAPNWTKDGKYLIYNSLGKLYRYDIATGEEKLVLTGFADMCNNDHVLSPDDSMIAVSHASAEDMQSRIYILPLVVEGEGQNIKPQIVTAKAPSYLHGWSPEGDLLAFCGERNGDGDYAVFTIKTDGSDEKKLTYTDSLDDGPEFSPDGKTIWFNSARSGLMQVWKMNVDGSNQTMVSNQNLNCWFPHISPDQTKVVYIAYFPGDLKPEEHLPDKRVQLRMMDADGSNDHLLYEFDGGQGSINVNSWSPCSKKIAYVTY